MYKNKKKYIYTDIYGTPPKIYLFCFFTGIYVVLQQFCVFLQILAFWRGVCLEPSPTCINSYCFHTEKKVLFLKETLSIPASSNILKISAFSSMSAFSSWRRFCAFEGRKTHFCFFADFSARFITLGLFFFSIAHVSGHPGPTSKGWNRCRML